MSDVFFITNLLRFSCHFALCRFFSSTCFSIIQNLESYICNIDIYKSILFYLRLTKIRKILKNIFDLFIRSKSQCHDNENQRHIVEFPRIRRQPNRFFGANNMQYLSSTSLRVRRSSSMLVEFKKKNPQGFDLSLFFL